MAGVSSLWVGRAREELDVRRGVVEVAAIARDGDQRRKFDDRWDGQNADGVVARAEVFGRREERGDFEPRLQRVRRDERRD